MNNLEEAKKKVKVMRGVFDLVRKEAETKGDIPAPNQWVIDFFTAADARFEEIQELLANAS